MLDPPALFSWTFIGPYVVAAVLAGIAILTLTLIAPTECPLDVRPTDVGVVVPVVLPVVGTISFIVLVGVFVLTSISPMDWGTFTKMANIIESKTAKGKNLYLKRIQKL
jgi:hypothetical protein